VSNEPTKTMSNAVGETEPTSGNGQAPVLLIAIFALLVFLGMVYLDGHGGGFDPQVYSPYMSYNDLKERQPKTTGGLDGKPIFNTYCAACHQATGMGLPGQFPPLAGSDWVNVDSPNRVIRIALYGFKGPVTVKGAQFNNSMPPWKPTLTPEQIAAVLTYVRQNKDWGNTAPPVTVDQVKAIMKDLGSRDDNSQFTSDELMQVPLN
jgi:mono/diheme cytochrome c family protein